jgi:hypothetical protein
MSFFEYDPEAERDIIIFKWIMFAGVISLVAGVISVIGWLIWLA